MALRKIQGMFKLSSGLSSRSVCSGFSWFIPSCYSNSKKIFIWQDLCEIQGLHVHHLLLRLQGQPTSLALLCSDSSYGTHFLEWQIYRSQHVLRSWAYTTVIVYMLCQLLPCISNYNCGILDGKYPSQVFDHQLVIFSFLNKPVENFLSVVSLETPLFLGYLEDGGRKLLCNLVTTHQSTPLWEPQVLHLKYHF